MLALVEISVTESPLCSQSAHLAHRSTFDASRRTRHPGGGGVIYFGPPLDRRTTVATSDRYVSLLHTLRRSHSPLLCGRARRFRVSGDGETAATGQTDAHGSV